MARIKYGLSNVHYAIATEGENGVLTYGTPKALPGAVAMSLEQQGDAVNEYADNILWFHMDVNNGYSGTLELEEISDDFRKDVLGETADTKGVLWENSESPVIEFALMFQFEVNGDPTVTGKRGALLRCTASRPSIAGSTREATVTPQHDTINITAMPRVADHIVKASCESTSAAYATWMTAVPTRAGN